MDKEELCEACEERPAEPLHSCPYAEELHDDDSERCTCCIDCQNECALSV